MDLVEEWRKKLSEMNGEAPLEHETLHRCPKCAEEGLEFNVQECTVRCAKCGFTVSLKK